VIAATIFNKLLGLTSVGSTIDCMGSKLSETNPYLRDPVKRKRALMRSVVSSSAIEGIRVSYKTLLSGTRKPAGKKARVKSRSAK